MKSLFHRTMLILALGLPVAAQAGADRYAFDNAHSRVIFFISHIGFSNMIGQFRAMDGYFTFDPAHPEQSTVEVTLKPRDIDTNHDGLNDKLQGSDFFNSDAYPTITFVSTKVKKTGKNTGTALGELTLRGVTRPVTLNITFNKAGVHPYTQDYVAGFTAETSIKRSDFGMNYGLPDTLGNDVRVHIEVEGINRTHNIRPQRQHR